MKLWPNIKSEKLKIALIKKYHTSLMEDDFYKLLQEESLLVRQAFIQQIEKLDVSTKVLAESMLEDASYVTKELALYKLWEAFPEYRSAYLNKLETVDGLPNKNIRLLWLTLALATPEYQPNKKGSFYSELKSYTNPNVHFEVRQGAFQYLNLLQAIDDDVAKNILDACNHHAWRFKKFARQLLKDLYASEYGKNLLLNLKPSLNLKQKEIMHRLLNTIDE